MFVDSFYPLVTQTLSTLLCCEPFANIDCRCGHDVDFWTAQLTLRVAYAPNEFSSDSSSILEDTKPLPGNVAREPVQYHRERTIKVNSSKWRGKKNKKTTGNKTNEDVFLDLFVLTALTGNKKKRWEGFETVLLGEIPKETVQSKSYWYRRTGLVYYSHWKRHIKQMKSRTHKTKSSIKKLN